MDKKANSPKSRPRYRLVEAFAGTTKVGEIVLTDDRQTWIAGVVENNEIVHIGSFATLDEAKMSLQNRLPKGNALTWRETQSYEKRVDAPGSTVASQ